MFPFLLSDLDVPTETQESPRNVSVTGSDSSVSSKATYRTPSVRSAKTKANRPQRGSMNPPSDDIQVMKMLPAGTVSRRLQDLEVRIGENHLQIMSELSGIRNFMCKCCCCLICELSPETSSPPNNSSALQKRINSFLDRLGLTCPCMS